MYDAVMRWARKAGAPLVVAVALGCAGTASAQSELAPNLPWPSLLPPMEVPNTVQPGPVYATLPPTVAIKSFNKVLWRADSAFSSRTCLRVRYCAASL